MNEMIKAINKIKNNECGIIIIKDNKIIHEDEGIGVSCIRKLIKTDPLIFKDAIIIDKVIGKAAAMLLIPFKIKKIHALILSENAKEILDQNNISNRCEKLVKMILNRNNDDMCPLEKSVLNIFDFNEAKIAIEKTIEILMNNK